jgi:cytochrome c-type biogenesis protein CcmH/NrfG
MTKLMRQLKNANGKMVQVVMGRIRKELERASMSIELKRSAYRHALRLSGHTNDDIIAALADAEVTR